MTAGGMPSRAEALRRMEGEWAALTEALSGLRDDQMQGVGVVGEWSAKDLVGHIAFWAQQAVRNTELVRAGRQRDIERPDKPEVTDRWNAREQQLRAGRSLAELRGEMEESHQRALAALRDLPEDKLGMNLNGGTFLELFAVDTYDHYREHTDQVLAWRRGLEDR